MRMLRTLFFVLLCLSLAQAAEWAHQGAVWSHGTDAQLTVPAGLTAEEDENGVLAVKHSSGAFYFSFIWASSAQEATQVVDAMIGQLKKDIPTAKLSEPRSVKEGGNTLTIQDGPGTINGNAFDVTVGTYTNGTKYLCIFALQSKAELEKWNKLSSELVGSIKFK